MGERRARQCGVSGNSRRSSNARGGIELLDKGRGDVGNERLESDVQPIFLGIKHADVVRLVQAENTGEPTRSSAATNCT
jgi:hypothetical protein